MPLAREHRGSLSDSMATVVPLSSHAELVALVAAQLAPFGVLVKPSAVHVKPYCYDARIGWDTYIVTIDGYGVWGMTDGPL